MIRTASATEQRSFVLRRARVKFTWGKHNVIRQCQQFCIQQDARVVLLFPASPN